MAEFSAAAVVAGAQGVSGACVAIRAESLPFAPFMDALGELVSAAGVEEMEGAGLSHRETDVLALVAAGQTNRQIAEALFMSEKTASVHVSRILTKLGVANRGQAAALAHRLKIFDERSAQ